MNICCGAQSNSWSNKNFLSFLVTGKFSRIPRKFISFKLFFFFEISYIFFYFFNDGKISCWCHGTLVVPFNKKMTSYFSLPDYSSLPVFVDSLPFYFHFIIPEKMREFCVLKPSSPSRSCSYSCLPLTCDPQPFYPHHLKGCNGPRPSLLPESTKTMRIVMQKKVFLYRVFFLQKNKFFYKVIWDIFDKFIYY